MARSGIFLVLALLLALAGCGKPAAPELTESDFNQSLTEFTSGTTDVIGGLQGDLAIKAITSKPSGSADPITLALGGISALSQQKTVSIESINSLLERAIPLDAAGGLVHGKWDYDPTANGGSGAWVKDTAYSGDDFILNWPFEDDNGGHHNASLVIDWNYGGSPTVIVKDQDGDSVEVPTSAKLTLYIDGDDSSHVAGYISGTFAWYTGSCGSILEPTSVNIQGRFGVSDYVEFNASLTVTDNRIATQGSIDAHVGSDSGHVSWNLSANGQATRGSNCFIDEFNVSGGHVNFQASTTSDGETESLEFNTDFTINYDDEGNLESIGLSNGFLKLNGRVAFTFEGVLDDSNENGIPGENVTIHFADGDTTLERLLQDYGVGSSSLLPGSF